MPKRLTQNQLKRRICRCVVWLTTHNGAVFPYGTLVALADGQDFMGFTKQLLAAMKKQGLIEYSEGDRFIRLTELAHLMHDGRF